MSDDLRQTGQTTNQIKNAPQNAIYIWPNSDFFYLRSLLKKLGRKDIRYYSPRALTDGRLMGIDGNLLVIDHAVQLSPEQNTAYQILMKMVPPKAESSGCG